MPRHILDANHLAACFAACAFCSFHMVLKVAASKESRVAGIPLLTLLVARVRSMVEVAANVIKGPLEPLEARRLASAWPLTITKEASPLTSLRLFQEDCVHALALWSQAHRQWVVCTSVIGFHRMVCEERCMKNVVQNSSSLPVTLCAERYRDNVFVGSLPSCCGARLRLQSFCRWTGPCTKRVCRGCTWYPGARLRSRGWRGSGGRGCLGCRCRAANLSNTLSTIQA